MPTRNQNGSPQDTKTTDEEEEEEEAAEEEERIRTVRVTSIKGLVTGCWRMTPAHPYSNLQRLHKKVRVASDWFSFEDGSPHHLSVFFGASPRSDCRRNGPWWFQSFGGNFSFRGSPCDGRVVGNWVFDFWIALSCRRESNLPMHVFLVRLTTAINARTISARSWYSRSRRVENRKLAMCKSNISAGPLYQLHCAYKWISRTSCSGLSGLWSDC